MTPPTPTHGSKAEVYFNGYDFSFFLNNFGLAANRDKADASVFKTTTKRYTFGLRDDALNMNGWFDAGKESFDELMAAAINSGDNVWTYFPYGPGFGNIGFSMAATVTKYESKTEVGSTASATVEAQSSFTDRVKSYVSEMAVTTSGSSAAYDYGAASTQVGALIVHGDTSGGTMTVTLQDSADNSTFADAAVATLTGGTALDPLQASKRVLTTNPLRRYVRVQYSGSGTLLSASVGRRSF